MPRVLVNNSTPSGVVQPYAGVANSTLSNPPAGWLFCNGSPISRSVYADLFSALSINLTNVTRSGTTLTPVGQNPIALGVEVGMPISGTGIPAGARVTARTTTTITISASAGSGSGGIADICPYGVGDGASTFNLPNTSGMFLRGAGLQALSHSFPVAGLRTFSAILGAKSVDSTAANGLDMNTVGWSDTHGHNVNFSHIHFVGSTDSDTGPSGSTGTTEFVSNYGTGTGPSVASSGPRINGAFDSTVAADSVTLQFTHDHTISSEVNTVETRPANIGIHYIIKI